MTAKPPLIKATGVSRNFPLSSPISIRNAIAGKGLRRKIVVQAVKNVSIEVSAGEAVGLVGESGSGKSSLGRVLAALDNDYEGTILYDGGRIKDLSKKERLARLLAVQMIFQDPFGSLNPRLRIREIIGEAPRVYGLTTRAQLDEHVEEALVRVGLDGSYLERFPHEFPGGQRQRVGIARALAVNPKVMICDEAVSALDVSVQAQIINLFLKLRSELGLAYIFISHDLGVVRHICDRVAVMYLGSIVESGSVAEVFSRPAHPYTQGLLSELSTDGGKRQFKPIKGEIPSPLSPPSGCAFHPRCPHATAECSIRRPEQSTIGPGHTVSCHLFP